MRKSDTLGKERNLQRAKRPVELGFILIVFEESALGDTRNSNTRLIVEHLAFPNQYGLIVTPPMGARVNTLLNL